MTRVPEQRMSDQLQQRCLARLWALVFPGDNGGLSHPDQLRRQGLDRERVRQREMADILDAEKDINSMLKGLKRIDANGRLVDTPPVEAVKTHSIIEKMPLEDNPDVATEDALGMLQIAARELSVRDLQQAINIRRIALIAEQEILNLGDCTVSTQPPSVEWTNTWRRAAETAFRPDLQQLYAKMIVQELISPGGLSLAVLSIPLGLDADELEMLRLLAKYRLGDIIVNVPGRYFDTEFHRGLFELMDDLGLMSGFGFDAHYRSFSSELNNEFRLTLQAGSKALRIHHPDIRELRLPIYNLSRSCRQLLSLFPVDSDLAYLYEVAQWAKAQNFDVQLGDWKEGDHPEPFALRMSL